MHIAPCCGVSRGKVPEEESLEATSENRHRGCGRDMLGHNVSSMCSSPAGDVTCIFPWTVCGAGKPSGYCNQHRSTLDSAFCPLHVGL